MSPQALLLAGLLMLLYSLGIAGLLYRHSRGPSPARAADALALGIAASPFVAGLLTLAGIALLGQHSNAAYTWLLFGAAIALVLISARALAEMCRGLPPLPPRSRLIAPVEWLLAAVLLLLLGVLAFLALVAPLIDNDALEYATVAKVLYERRTLDAYPLVEADPRTGMFAPWTHPPLYVALIFLGYVLQGDPDTPGLMRLIAPGCVVATLILLSRVCMRSQGERGVRLALLACIVVLATPLLRRMVAGASIDGLPILGLALPFAAAVLYAEEPAKTRIAVAGIALGLALWSHSQAILFPVLVAAGIAAMRWSERRPFVAECAKVVAVGATVGCLPYLRNLIIYGSLISDAPAVYALEALDWKTYVTAGRGLSGAYDLLVMGVLKGWASYSEFWLTFWLAGVGVALLAWRWSRLKGVAPETGHTILVGALAIVATYFLGTVASVIVGSDQMVRNPRYLLPVVPLAALLAADPLARLPTALGRLDDVRRIGSKLTFLLQIDLKRPAPVGLILLLWGVALVCDRAAATLMEWRVQLGSLRAAAFAPQEVALSKFAFYRVQSHMRDTLPPDAVILTLRPADMYYARHRMISYLDPRLIPAYLERDPERMTKLLRQLGVTHVHRPHYSIPPLYNSALIQVLADDRLSRLIYDDSHYAVFALDPRAQADRSHEPPRTVAKWDLTPGKYTWTGYTESTMPVLGSHCRVDGIRVTSSNPQPTVRACAYLPAHRAFYLSGAGALYQRAEGARTLLQAVPGATYRYTATLSGKGFVGVNLYERSDGWNAYHVDDGDLLAAGRTFTRLFRLPDEVTHFRLAFWVVGEGELSIRDVTVEAFAPK